MWSRGGRRNSLVPQRDAEVCAVEYRGACRLTNAATDSRFIELWRLRRHSYLSRLQLS